MNRIVTAINRTLKQLQSKGEQGAFVVFKATRCANYYLQFRFQNGRRELYGECVSNHYLDAAHAIGDVGLEILDDAGWSQPSDAASHNYSQLTPIRAEFDLDEVAAQTAMVMMAVFGVESLNDVTVNLYLGQA